MDNIIQLLPDALANQIAAGEVIQRPASVVKELMENAIDAGADRIKLIIKDSGKALIQVIDNGKGMSEIDARLCFDRHATSKIRKADDLFAINTMGFRGEALASIAAVAQVELKTRQKSEELGTQILIEASEIKVQEVCQAPIGTSIAVKNLFFNIPARRKFLKSKPVENRHILEEFQRIALAHANKSFSLHNDTTEVFRLPSTNLRKRIVGLFGNNFNDRLVPVDESTDFLRIYGFIGKPKYARKSRGDQYFFVNNRFIKSSYLHHALVSAYEGLLQEKSYPFYVLFIDIDPDRIDVNVHPSKQEIKFEDEKVVYTFIHAAVKRSLGAYSITPVIDFDQNVNLNPTFLTTIPSKPINQSKSKNTQPESNLPQSKDSNTTLPKSINLSSKGNQRSFQSKGSGSGKGGFYHKERIPKNWEQLYETTPIDNKPPLETDAIDLSNAQADEETETLQTITLQSNVNPQSSLELDIQEQVAHEPSQLHNQYILYQIKSGFILVNQQAAHERILYEKFAKTYENAQLSSQQLLFPQTIELPIADAELLKSILPAINQLGYDIRSFGQHTFVVHGVPADLNKPGEELKVIEGFIDQYKQNLSNIQLDHRERLLRAMAKNNAIKNGQALSIVEMRSLVDQLFACATPYVAPNGKPTFITYHLENIAKLFA